MRAIQMVDLKQQYAKIKDQIDAGIQEVLDSAAFINGPAVQAFTTEFGQYLGSRHIIPCANGTDALQIVLMALGLEPGDEVITPSFTYIATTEVVALLRLKPVFVEVDPKTFCMDPKSLQAAITPRTKAIVPVHLYGQAAPMAEILEIARRHAIYVIEDNAQAIGSSYTFPDGTTRKTGTMGIAGCTSFFPAKNLGCYGDGGAICTDDEALAAKMRMIANHGQSKQYYHDIVGCNSRLDAIQAAVLRVKLRELDGYIEARRKVADFYDAAFKEHAKITVPFRASYSRHIFHQYTLQLEGASRDALKGFLAMHGIPAMIYYPVPGHQQKMFAGEEGPAVHLEVTDRLTEKVISLPMHTELDEEQLFHITGKVLEFINHSKQ
jgi:UDP-2-acetamido-2-deoxy-ribo-hexuluronate aminotransferase